MAAKKERGRFSLRFNISDPIHLATVELLEKQPDHGKAQYIANAVVFYDTHFADDPQPLRAAAPAIDRAAIEAIVREILLQETRHSEKPAAAPAACPVSWMQSRWLSPSGVRVNGARLSTRWPAAALWGGRISALPAGEGETSVRLAVHLPLETRQTHSPSPVRVRGSLGWISRTTPRAAVLVQS